MDFPLAPRRFFRVLLSPSLPLVRALVSGSVFLFSPGALADVIAPEALMRQITDDVTSAIRKDPKIDLAALAEQKILPHFNARRATQLAMGANWRRATPDEQERLVREFTRLLLRTYSRALAGYRDQAFEFKAVRPQSANEITVRSLVKDPGSIQTIAVDYDMELSADGWKVVDVTVSGVGLVATYRTSFAEEVRNRGVEGLISLLSNKNRT